MRLSPTHNRSSEIHVQHFEHNKIWDGNIFDFYTGLPHIHVHVYRQQHSSSPLINQHVYTCHLLSLFFLLQHFPSPCVFSSLPSDTPHQSHSVGNDCVTACAVHPVMAFLHAFLHAGMTPGEQNANSQTEVG